MKKVFSIYMDFETVDTVCEKCANQYEKGGYYVRKENETVLSADSICELCDGSFEVIND